MNSEGSICTSLFYGSDYKVNEKLVKIAKNSKDIEPYKIQDLVNGPSVTWKVFKKQAEALGFISKYKHNLMAFAFESDNSRLFLVAHPEVFWHYDCQRPPSCRCSYEIIPENAVCKLYFDLEYNIPLNTACNGPRMVQNFIVAVIFFLQEQFKIDCNISHIVNLDASTDRKFSRHLIFVIPNVCFASNDHAGNFVNYVCKKILDKIESKSPESPPGNLSVENCLEMVVLDAKQKKTLFCDLSVYSRNRHFRLYKSTKYGKFAPLVCSSDSNIVVTDNDSDKKLFIDSLITYIPVDHEKLNVLCFKKDNTNCQRLLKNKDNSHFDLLVTNEISASPYKDIDNFINELVFPGKIYRSFYFSTSKVINYDIVGNRFCGNIGRQHKSNNIKYVVDLKDGTYYQKCHDYECSAYKSEKNSLPRSLQLLDFSDCSSGIGVFDISENIEHSLERFPSCGLSDEEIINHLSNQPFQRFPSFDLSDEQINHLENSAFQRFPSFDLSDEALINHLSAENLNI